MAVASTKCTTSVVKRLCQSRKRQRLSNVRLSCSNLKISSSLSTMCPRGCVVADQRARKDHTTEALEASTILLALNPEFFTAWNYRREILLDLLTEDNTERLISDDLDLTQRFLRKHPKVYCLWNHRRWCLIEITQRLPATAIAYWKEELALVQAMLKIDARNCA